jgi:hypothetical protein
MHPIVIIIIIKKNLTNLKIQVEVDNNKNFMG